jgi:hypothetical protein
MAVLVTALCLVAGLLAGPAAGTIDQVSVSSVAPQWIRPSSGPVAVLGINIFSLDGTGKLLNLSVNFTDYGSDGGFNASDLAPLGADSSSGATLYMDNKTSGSFGTFDRNDSLAPLSALPSWNQSGGDLATTFCTGGLTVPTDDLGNNSGHDFFVVVRTSARAADGDDFTAFIGSGDVVADSGPLSFDSARTGSITVDAFRPKADAGADLTVDEGVLVTFNGGASTDNAGIANYSWFFGDFAPDSWAYGPTVYHTFSSQGKYIVVLNVTDHAGGSDEDTLTVTVRNINRPPVIISAPPATAIQGETYFYIFQASDPDGDTLRYSLAEGPPDMTVDAGLGLVVWTPGPYDVGARKVILSVTDSKSAPLKQSYYISVQNVNDPPRFNSLPVLGAMQGQPYSYQAAVVDPDDYYNLNIEFSVIAGPKGMTITPYGGLVGWTPAADEVGLNRVVLGVTDRQLWAYQDFDINVTDANDAPVMLSVPVTTAIQGAFYRYQVRAFDPDGDELRHYLDAHPTNMSLDTGSGLVSWVPASDQTGPQFVRLEVIDGHGGVSNQSFYIMVANVNDPPVMISALPEPARQGALWTHRVVAWDPDGDELEYSLLAAPEGMTINSTSGLLEWTPGQEAVGSDQVAVRASDGNGGLVVQSFNLTVQDINDPPVMEGTIAPVAYQGRAYVSIVHAYDPDGDQLTFSLVTQLPNMEIDRHSGVLVWYPARPQVGEYHIAVNVTDENGSVATEVYNVTVIATNDPPHVRPLGVLRARAGERFRFTVQATDPDGDRLLFSSTSRLFRINATTGEISFVPGDGTVGMHEFWVEVIDPGGLNATAWGVVVIGSRPSGTPAARLAGYGLAGLGGLNPWLILAISMALAGGLSAEYFRLRGLEKRQQEAARKAADAERPAVAPRTKKVRKLKRGEACGFCGREISIKPGSDNHACSCGAKYHSKCFRKAGKCPECGRGKGRPR